MRPQGEIEAAICEAVSRFEQDYMGRGLKDIRIHLLGDLLVVRLRGGLDSRRAALGQVPYPRQGPGLAEASTNLRPRHEITYRFGRGLIT